MGIELEKVQDTFRKEDGIWFDYPGDKEVKIKIRPLYPEKANELYNRCLVNSRAGKIVDEEKLNILSSDYIIVDWEGISLNGSSECNREAKKIITLYCAEIVDFCTKKSRELAQSIVQQDEEVLKNLKSSPGMQ